MHIYNGVLVDQPCFADTLNDSLFTEKALSEIWSPIAQLVERAAVNR